MFYFNNIHFDLLTKCLNLEKLYMDRQNYAINGWSKNSENLLGRRIYAEGRESLS